MVAGIPSFCGLCCVPLGMAKKRSVQELRELGDLVLDRRQLLPRLRCGALHLVHHLRMACAAQISGARRGSSGASRLWLLYC